MSEHPQRMDVQDFRQACEMIWGPRFGVEAAAALGVSARAVHNYRTGSRLVPHTMPARLKACALAHIGVLERVVAALDAFVATGAPIAPTGSAEAAPPVAELEPELEPLGDPDEWDDDV